MALLPVSLIVKGIVGDGFAKARSSGYPTANLTPREPLTILQGIYCALTTVQESNEAIPSVVFYGIPYELPGVTAPRFEVHLFEKDGTLYGQELTVQLVAFVRENKKFEDAEQLHAAIEKDIAIAKEYFTTLS